MSVKGGGGGSIEGRRLIQCSCREGNFSVSSCWKGNG